jgi:hypothetical protein
MNAKPFIFTVVAVVVVGIVLGGTFIGGVTLGRTQAETEPQPAFPQAPSAQAGLAGGTGGQIDQAQIQQLRQRVQSGEITPEEVQRLRAQIQAGGAGAGGSVAGTVVVAGAEAGSGTSTGGAGAVITSLADAGARAMGTVKSVEDGVLTVESFQGTVTVNVSADTKVQGLTEVSLSDVEVDLMAVVLGERTESGEFEASSVIILPEGIFPGAGLRRAGGGFGGGGQ